MTDTRDELVAIIKAADDNSVETHRQWLLTPEQMADAIAPWLMDKLTQAAVKALRDAADDFADTDLDGPDEWADVDDWLRQQADAIVARTAAVESQVDGAVVPE